MIKYLPFICLVLLAGCASNSTPAQNTDPFRNFNEATFAFMDRIDRNILQPVAQTYDNNTPDPLRGGITNFFDNLYYPNTILNTFLQGKIGRGFADTARFLVNSTIGLGGLLDVGTKIGLEAHDEDFGQTLAVWGIAQGPYLYLPLLGPYTGRHSVDLVPRALLTPLIYLDTQIAIPLGILNLINSRADLLEQTQTVDETALSPYLFIRDAYLQRRNFLIYDGNPPVEGLDDFFNQ